MDLALQNQKVHAKYELLRCYLFLRLLRYLAILSHEANIFAHQDYRSLSSKRKDGISANISFLASALSVGLAGFNAEKALVMAF